MGAKIFENLFNKSFRGINDLYQSIPLAKPLI